ncbi:GNAT family N-acetyltransferase [Massilia sp. DWR3-1-1]|uniref:GNAT family N-acetyltransferase n=1 Tax=Massilia sp. DWR3-1-1 TaxID=2804559 RepID=UPI003CF657C3
MTSADPSTPFPVLRTARLRLEPLDDCHYDGLQHLNSMPEVMRYISGRPETAAETVAIIARVKDNWRTFGYGWWAFIDHASGQLIGAGCIQHLARDAANPLEIGWRLLPATWGQGYASEAARAMAGHAFEVLRVPRLLAVCNQDNSASARVMQRLGMSYRGIERWYDIDTSVYAIEREAWLARAALN